MKMNEDLAIIQSYLCADGYVTYGDKPKYYRIGFRNTNLVLLKDFKERFERYFKVTITLKEGERCYKSSKEIYWKLTKQFGSFYSREWTMPKLSKNISKRWLRAFFDCEGWVFCKTHQNRHIGLDSINEKGLNEIIKMLNNLGIKTIKKINFKRGMYRVFIYGKENITKFEEEIGFLHPDKSKKIKETIKDFMVYIWNFPKNEKEVKNFVKKIMHEKAKIKHEKYIRIISKERINLERLKEHLGKYFKVNSLLYSRMNGIGNRYYELDINKKKEVQRLIKLNIIPNTFKLKKS